MFDPHGVFICPGTLDRFNKAIAEATEESHKISTLRANGLLDADACAVRMNAISAKLALLTKSRTNSRGML